MMKLYFSPLSPYVRKVSMTAAIKNLASRLETIAADTNTGDNVLNARNPLAKIPCLLTEGGDAIYDSNVICEYLDATGSGPMLFPRGGDARWRTLTLGALADGILDASLLIVYEKRFRPEDRHVQSWLDRQQSKIDRALAHLENAPPKWSGHPDYGHVTLACALGYQDLRFEGRWRAGHPRLVAWLDAISAAVPSFEATRPAA